eukprot:scaffold1389_cov176-Skeletonema_marinoi.AAC.3
MCISISHATALQVFNHCFTGITGIVVPSTGTLVCACRCNQEIAHQLQRKLGKQNVTNHFFAIFLTASSFNRRGSSLCIELIFYCIISGNRCGLHIRCFGLQFQFTWNTCQHDEDVLAYSFSGVSGTFPALDLAQFSRSFLSGSSWVPVPTYLPSPLCEFESAGKSKESARNLLGESKSKVLG